MEENKKVVKKEEPKTLTAEEIAKKEERQKLMDEAYEWYKDLF